MQASLYRMVLPTHTCPFGEKALELLHSSGYEVEDNQLKTREETETFKSQHGVSTTPLIFIEGQPIGGYDELRKFLMNRSRGN